MFEWLSHKPGWLVAAGIGAVVAVYLGGVDSNLLVTIPAGSAFGAGVYFLGNWWFDRR